MTQQELKDKILLAMYERYKSGKSNEMYSSVLCQEEGIQYDSEQALRYAMDALQDDGFVKIQKFVGGLYYITKYNSSAIDYVEKRLLPKMKEAKVASVTQTSTANEPAPETEKNNQKSEEEPSQSTAPQSFHTATKIDKNVVDADMSPCFGVDSLARCFASQLERVAFADHDNVSMIGIFGPWGRGKSYFFSRVEDVLDEKYKVVRFSAWKYQNTPAIWAYLYETIYSSLGCISKSCLWIINVFSVIWSALIKFVVALILIMILSCVFCEFESSSVNLINWGVPVTMLGFVIYIVSKLRGILPTAYKLIEKYSHRKSYESYLGIQNEIERDLAGLLKLSICHKKKWMLFRKERMLLYIDDIDRCSPQKMIEIVDSLRTILENEEIRKRLIVVCSVDVEKLKQGYKNAFKDVWEKDKADELAREQIDKLFIFSIGLSPLDNSQKNNFIDNLVTIKKETTDADNNVIPYSTSRVVGSLIALRNDEQLTSVDETVLANWLKHSIEGKGELTPRKLRIIFYQLLFANNILARGGENIIMLETTAQGIINKSLGEREKIDINVAQSDVVDMVVPY